MALKSDFIHICDAPEISQEETVNTSYNINRKLQKASTVKVSDLYLSNFDRNNRKFSLNNTYNYIKLEPESRDKNDSTESELIRHESCDDENRVVTKKSISWQHDVVQTMWELWQENLFCDVLLLGRDQISTVAHSIVLAASSPVLKDLLKEYTMKNSLPGEIILQLQEFSYLSIQAVVEFMYTGEIDVAATDLAEITNIATKFKIYTLMKKIGILNVDILNIPFGDQHEALVKLPSYDAPYSKSDYDIHVDENMPEENKHFIDASVHNYARSFNENNDNTMTHIELTEEDNDQDNDCEFPRTLEKEQRATKSSEDPLTCMDQTIVEDIQHLEMKWDTEIDELIDNVARASPKAAKDTALPYSPTSTDTQDTYVYEEAGKKSVLRHNVVKKHTILFHTSNKSNRTLQKTSEKKSSCEVKEPAPERVLRCSYCDQKFYRLGRLKAHEARHRGDFNYTCDVCGKGYQVQESYNAHVRSHIGLPPDNGNLCSTCGFVCTTRKGLIKHQRTMHDRIEEFCCTVCGVTFRHKSSLVYHMNRHRPDEKFKCMLCKKVFTCHSNLIRHARIHTGEKPYSCDVCGKRFNQSQTVKSHKQQLHNIGGSKHKTKITDIDQRIKIENTTAPFVTTSHTAITPRPQIIIQSLNTMFTPSASASADGLMQSESSSTNRLATHHNDEAATSFITVSRTEISDRPDIILENPNDEGYFTQAPIYVKIPVTTFN